MSKITVRSDAVSTAFGRIPAGTAFVGRVAQRDDEDRHLYFRSFASVVCLDGAAAGEGVDWHLPLANGVEVRDYREVDLEIAVSPRATGGKS